LCPSRSLGLARLGNIRFIIYAKRLCDGRSNLL
jgi:hypothetical protein